MFLNKKNHLFFCLFGLCFFVSACLSFNKKNLQFSLSQDQIAQMNQGLDLMENKRFLKAAEIYDNLTQNIKDKSSKIFVLFNSGVAYKEAKHCQKALTRFRHLLDLSLKNTPFRSRGLLEISSIYECLGNKEASLLSLKDVETVRSSLPWILNNFVYPARLSIAYAQMGETSKAEQYKSLSLTKILQLKQSFSSEEELNKNLSRTFYLMGRSYVKKENIEAEVFFKAFSYHQLYLLQSVFLKNKKWSKISQTELESLFKKLIFSLSTFKGKNRYKTLIINSLGEGKILVKKENSKKWNNFYSKNSKIVLNLLSK